MSSADVSTGAYSSEDECRRTSPKLVSRRISRRHSYDDRQPPTSYNFPPLSPRHLRRHGQNQLSARDEVHRHRSKDGRRMYVGSNDERHTEYTRGYNNQEDMGQRRQHAHMYSNNQDEREQQHAVYRNRHDSQDNRTYNAKYEHRPHRYNTHGQTYKRRDKLRLAGYSHSNTSHKAHRHEPRQGHENRHHRRQYYSENTSNSDSCNHTRHKKITNKSRYFCHCQRNYCQHMNTCWNPRQPYPVIMSPQQPMFMSPMYPVSYAFGGPTSPVMHGQTQGQESGVPWPERPHSSHQYKQPGARKQENQGRRNGVGGGQENNTDEPTTKTNRIVKNKEDLVAAVRIQSCVRGHQGRRSVSEVIIPRSIEATKQAVEVLKLLVDELVHDEIVPDILIELLTQSGMDEMVPGTPRSRHNSELYNTLETILSEVVAESCDVIVHQFVRSFVGDYLSSKMAVTIRHPLVSCSQDLIGNVLDEEIPLLVREVVSQMVADYVLVSSAESQLDTVMVELLQQVATQALFECDVESDVLEIISSVVEEETHTLVSSELSRVNGIRQHKVSIAEAQAIEQCSERMIYATLSRMLLSTIATSGESVVFYHETEKLLRKEMFRTLRGFIEERCAVQKRAVGNVAYSHMYRRVCAHALLSGITRNHIEDAILQATVQVDQSELQELLLELDEDEIEK